MRVGIGAVVGITGGPATYARELVAALAALDAGDRYVVFTDRPGAFAGMDLERVEVPLRRSWQQVTWDHVRLPALLARAHLDVYHGTKNVLPWRCPVPAIVTVHDLAVYACPETFARRQRLHFRLCVPPSVARAARVIAVSAHARDDLRARFGLAPERVTVIPNGLAAVHRMPADAAAVAALRARHGLGERVVVCAGTVQPRKRVDRVVEAFTLAGAASRGWQLAIAGRLRPGYRPAWLEALPPGVRWLGPLDDPALHALYAAGAVAMSASEYEGFGLTVLEAMAAGCAVIAVGVTSVPEVVGDAGVLVPSSDAGQLAAALARLLDDEAARARLGARARDRAARFTWTDAARRTRAVYAEVAR